MPRPRRLRWVQCEPDVVYFKPRGVPMRELEEVILTVDEFEAMRLKHYKKLDQLEACKQMNISQPTFHRILERAHEKVTRALHDGFGIRIEGGNYITGRQHRRQRERINQCYFVSSEKITGGEKMIEDKKGIPKRDGSGNGTRDNRGRGGCNPVQDQGTNCPKRGQRLRRHQRVLGNP